MKSFLKWNAEESTVGRAFALLSADPGSIPTSQRVPKPVRCNQKQLKKNTGTGEICLLHSLQPWFNPWQPMSFQKHFQEKEFLNTEPGISPAHTGYGSKTKWRGGCRRNWDIAQEECFAASGLLHCMALGVSQGPQHYKA